jgi:ketosteroid isomerase-like protein
MSELQPIADRVEIEALRGEFTDATMDRDYDRLASLFTQDAVLRIPAVNVEFVGRQEIRAGLERLGEGVWDYLVQTTHPGTIQLEGDTASGRAYVQSFGHMRDGSSHLNYSAYHDRYQRTPDGGSSPNASTRSDTSTPLLWRARCQRESGRRLLDGEQRRRPSP